MKPRIPLIALVTFLVRYSMSQAPPAILWQTSYGGSLDDHGYAIAASDDGGYIVAGSTKSEDFDITGHHGTPGSDDVLVLKFDSLGAVQWQKCLGGTGQEVAFDMVATANGGCVLACSASSTNGDVVGVTGGSDFWLVGIDGNGDILWQQVLGGSSSDWRLFMDATSDGGMVLCGETQSFDGDISTNHGISDLWVAKLDVTGTIEWENSFGGSLAEVASGIVQNAAGGYYVSGFTKSNDGDVTGNHGGLYDGWVLSLDSSGGMLWQRALGGSGTEWLTSLAEDHGGGVICAGSSTSSDGDLSGNFGSGDLWVVDLDNMGAIQWQQNIGYGWNDGARCVKRSADDGYILAGATLGPNGTDGGLWVLAIDSVGNTVWETSIGGSNTEEAIDLLIDEDNDLLVTGWSTSGDGDLSINHGFADLWTVKLTWNYTTVTDPSDPGARRNSAGVHYENGALFLSGLASGPRLCRVFDALGQLVVEEVVAPDGTGRAQMRVKNLPAGAYVLAAQGFEAVRFLSGY